MSAEPRLVKTQGSTGKPCEHDGLVSSIARRYLWGLSQGGLEWCDLMQVGRMAVERARETYDTERGVTFGTYAGRWIRHYLHREVQRRGYTVRIPRNSGYVAWTKGEPMVSKRVALELVTSEGETVNRLDRLGHVVEADEERADAVWNSPRAMAVIARMPERWQQVLEMKYGDDMSLAEVGRRLGISRERARQLELRALERLREELNRE